VEGRLGWKGESESSPLKPARFAGMCQTVRQAYREKRDAEEKAVKEGGQVKGVRGGEEERETVKGEKKERANIKREISRSRREHR